MKAKSLAHQIITFFVSKVFQEMAKIRPVSLREVTPIYLKSLIEEIKTQTYQEERNTWIKESANIFK